MAPLKSRRSSNKIQALQTVADSDSDSFEFLDDSDDAVYTVSLGDAGNGNGQFSDETAGWFTNRPPNDSVELPYAAHKRKGFKHVTSSHISEGIYMLASSNIKQQFEENPLLAKWYRVIRQRLRQYGFVSLNKDGTIKRVLISGSAENAVVDAVLQTLPDSESRRLLSYMRSMDRQLAYLRFSNLEYAVHCVDPTPVALEHAESLFDEWELNPLSGFALDPNSPNVYQDLYFAMDSMYRSVTSLPPGLFLFAQVLYSTRVQFPQLYARVHHKLARYKHTAYMYESQAALEKVVGYFMGLIQKEAEENA